MARSAIPAEPTTIVAIQDSREQTPLELDLPTEIGTLATGDYSVRGLEHVVAIERKSLPDFLACCGVERERFSREMMRMRAYDVGALVIEASWPDLERGEWRSQVTPAAAVGSALGWIAMGIPVVMAGDHARAGKVVSRLLWIAARRRWREARALVGSLGNVGASPETTGEPNG